MKYLEALGLSILGVFAPIRPMLITAIILILADLITGLLASKKQKIPITSAGIRRTFAKFFLYISGICIGYISEVYLLDGFLAVSKIAAGLIAVVELKSFYENINIISGNNIFKSLVDKLGSANDVREIASEVEKKEQEETPKED